MCSQNEIGLRTHSGLGTRLASRSLGRDQSTQPRPAFAGLPPLSHLMAAPPPAIDPGFCLAGNLGFGRSSARWLLLFLLRKTDSFSVLIYVDGPSDVATRYCELSSKFHAAGAHEWHGVCCDTVHANFEV